ncbi:folD [Symbiodinium natans]|uniref:FolD protein n=1 Tax=Symbiodinium natans TaxID=878477 RepID=A0A812I9Z9_9DINO|nr:folD [Symbiodinium natans]
MAKDSTGLPTNVAADLKTGVKPLHRHVGEARPLEADGSCSHHLLVRDGNSTDCILPQRIDVGKHYIMTGGPEAIREPFEDMVSRASSFGRYMFDLSAMPVVEELFAGPKFQRAAKGVCPPSKQVLDPFQYNFILSVPGQTVALHLDAPWFLGATRFQFPQWLLAVMVFSNLFQDRFVDQVQVVGYLHDRPALDDDSGGRFLYYDENSATPKAILSKPLSGVAVDGSKTLHAAGVFRPDVKAPLLDKDKDNALFYVGDEQWELRSDGEVLQTYNSSDLRMTIVYRARCFASEEERLRFRAGAAEDQLSLEAVLGRLTEDLVRRQKLSRASAQSIDRLDLATLLLDTYVQYPLPAWAEAWIPLNYCALPRRAGKYKDLLKRLLSPLCA